MSLRYLLVFLIVASASALDVDISYPVQEDYQSPPSVLNVSFSESPDSWGYALNDAYTQACSSSAGQNFTATRDNGVRSDNWILVGNNDAQIRYPASMMPSFQYSAAKVCVWLYDNSATQENNVQFRVNNGATVYNIKDDASIPVGSWVKKCADIGSADFSDHYDITMWYENRATTGGMYLANSQAVTGSISYWSNDANNAPAAQDSQMSWYSYGGNIDWMISMEFSSPPIPCPLSASVPINSSQGENLLNVTAIQGTSQYEDSVRYTVGQPAANVSRIISPADGSVMNGSIFTLTADIAEGATGWSYSIDSGQNITGCQSASSGEFSINYTDGNMSSSWPLYGDNDARINFDDIYGTQTNVSFCFYLYNADPDRTGTFSFRVNDRGIYPLTNDEATLPLGTWTWACKDIDPSDFSNNYSISMWYTGRSAPAGIFLGNDDSVPGVSSFHDNTSLNLPDASNEQILWTRYMLDTDWMVSANIMLSDRNCSGPASATVSSPKGSHSLYLYTSLPAGTTEASASYEIIDVEDIQITPSYVEPGTSVTIAARAVSTPGESMKAYITPAGEAEIALDMHDDGQHGDGAAGDDVYAVSYTAQQATQYKVAVVLSKSGVSVRRTTEFGARNTRAGVAFSETTYDAMKSLDAAKGIEYIDIVTSAQHELLMAGIPFDILSDEDLSDPDVLKRYDAIILPSLSNVESSKRDPVIAALESAVRDEGIGIVASGDLLTMSETNQPYTYPAGQSPLNRIMNAAVSASQQASVSVRAADHSHPSAWRYTQDQVVFSSEWIAFSSVDAYNRSAQYSLPFQASGVGAALASAVGKGRAFYIGSSPIASQSALYRDGALWVMYGSDPHLGIKMTDKNAIFTNRVDADVSYDTAQTIAAISNYRSLSSTYNLKGGWYIVTRHSDTSPVSWEQLRSHYNALISDGHEIGSHSVTHPGDINLLDDAGILHEMQASREEIGGQLGIDVKGFATPGDQPTDIRVWRIADQAGYKYYSPYQEEYYKGLGLIGKGIPLVSLKANMISDYEIAWEYNLTDEQAIAQWISEYDRYYDQGDGIMIFVMFHDYLLDEKPQIYQGLAQHVASTDYESITPADLADRFNAWMKQDFKVESTRQNGTEEWKMTRLNPDVQFGQITPGREIRSSSGALKATPDGKSYIFSFAGDTATFIFDYPLTLEQMTDISVIQNETVSIQLEAAYTGTGNLSYSKDAAFGALDQSLFTWTPDTSGNYTVEFTVTDGTYSDSKTARIEVLPLVVNSPPVLSEIGPVSAAAGAQVVITASATDADNDTLTYSINDTRFSQAQNVFTWQTAAGDEGNHSVRVTVSDGKADDSVIAAVEVTPVNRQTVTIGQNDGTRTDNWILVGNNDLQIRFPQSMIPQFQYTNVSVCPMLYDNSATQENNVQFRVNNGATVYNIKDDTTIPVGRWVWKCADIAASDFSDHYDITMWYENRATTGGMYIANNGAVAGTISYWSNDANNAPAAQDSQMSWYSYGGNTDWVINMTFSN